MFASNLSPNIGSDTWWDWYKYPTASDGTPDVNAAPDLQGDNGSPDFTATDVFKWLNPVDGAFALGAGAVIGTQDDGFTASASIAFVLILPGPVIMLIGKANILSPRISGPAEEANFEAMATYDGNAGTFDLVIEAQYSIPVVVDVQATGELYVDPSVPVWYLAIGKPPHAAACRRPRARPVRVRLLLRRQQHRTGRGLLGRVQELVVVRAAERLDRRLPGGNGRDPVVAAPARRRRRAARRGPAERVRDRARDHRRRPDRGHRTLAVVGVRLAFARARPPLAAAQRRRHGVTVVGRQRPAAACAARASRASTRRLSTTARATATSCWPIAPAARSMPSPLPTPSSTTRRRQGSSTRCPRATGRRSTPPPTSRRTRRSCSPISIRARSRHAALVPQDSHFALSFAHATADQAGFDNSVVPPPELVAVSPPPSLGADDMSNINLQPPAVQWCIHHTLVQVALYQFSGSGEIETWELVAATPQSASGWSNAAPLPLVGSWVAPDPTKNTPGCRHRPQADAVHRLARRGLHGVVGGRWRGVRDELQRPGTAVHRRCRSVPPPPSPRQGRPGGRPGAALLGVGGLGQVTISFPCPVVLAPASGRRGRGGRRAPGVPSPGISSGGQPLDPTGGESRTRPGSTRSPTRATVSEHRPRGSGPAPVYLMGLAWRRPTIDMPILPEAPGLYALKIVTQVEVGQPDSNGNVSYQPVADGDPVIEFAYLQTHERPRDGDDRAGSRPQRRVHQPLTPIASRRWPPLASAARPACGGVPQRRPAQRPFDLHAVVVARRRGHAPPTTATTSTSSSTRRTSTRCTPPS